MLVKHIVLIQFKETCDSIMVSELSQAFESLQSLIPGITSFETGQNVSPEGLNHGFTHAFVITFNNIASRDAYLPHPKHLEFVERLKPNVNDVLVLDYLLQST